MQDLARRKVINLLNDDLEPAASPVSQEAFTSAMTNQWLALGNTPSAPLQHIWGTMAAAFNDASCFATQYGGCFSPRLAPARPKDCASTRR